MTVDEDAGGEDETSAVEQTLRVETLDPARIFAEIAKIEADEAAAKASTEAADDELPQEGTVVMEAAPMLGPRATNAAWAAKSKRKGSSTPPPPMDAGQLGLERGPGQTFVLTRSDPPPAMQPDPTWPPPLATGAPEAPTLRRRRRRDGGALVAGALLVVVIAMLVVARVAFGL